MDKPFQIDKNYSNWLKELKNKIRTVQLKAAVRVNSGMLNFYWELGADIVEKQTNAKWGEGFLSKLSQDLMCEFPGIKGFSKRNLELIRQWYLFYNQETTIAKQAVSQLIRIPWGHNIAIIAKCKNIHEALYYVHKTMVHRWSRSVLVHQIKSGLYGREGKAITNFTKTLPPPQSDLALQTLKDPYVFDFLIDLLFYHTHLHCYLVLELKNIDFEPEQAGKLNFYIKAVDSQYRQEGDKPTIGLLLCKNKDKLVVEYALSDIHKPIGVSEYQLTKSLPKNLKPSLPSVEELEQELAELGKKKKGLEQ